MKTCTYFQRMMDSIGLIIILDFTLSYNDFYGKLNQYLGIIGMVVYASC